MKTTKVFAFFFRKYHFSVSIYIDQQFRFSVIHLLLRGHSNRETNEAQLYSTSQLGFVYGRLLILQSELWDHNLFKKNVKIHEECATAHEQNKYRATSGVGSKKNLNRFHLGFAWTFYMIMAARLSNNSRASDGFFFNRNFLDLKLLLLPNVR